MTDPAKPDPTSRQMHILAGLQAGHWYVSASEAAEIPRLIDAGLVESWSTVGGFPAWRITQAGRDVVRRHERHPREPTHDSDRCENQVDKATAWDQCVKARQEGYEAGYEAAHAEQQQEGGDTHSQERRRDSVSEPEPDKTSPSSQVAAGDELVARLRQPARPPTLMNLDADAVRALRQDAVQAADRIEAQAAEIERLREILEELTERCEEACEPGRTPFGTHDDQLCVCRAREALAAAEPPPKKPGE